MGWYVHTFSDTFEPVSLPLLPAQIDVPEAQRLISAVEQGFGMIDEDGKTKIDGWKPERC